MSYDEPETAPSIPSDAPQRALDQVDQFATAAPEEDSDGAAEIAGRPRRPVRIAIVNDYEVIVAGVRAMLEPYAERIVVVDLEVRSDPDHQVDVALFDTYGRADVGWDRLQSLVTNEHVGAVVVYSWNVTQLARQAALAAGAREVVAKSLPALALVDTLERVAARQELITDGFDGIRRGTWPGAQWGLSARESETLALLVTGMSNRSIAEALFVSENTVRSHLRQVFRKLGVTTRSQAVARVMTDPSFADQARAALAVEQASRAEGQYVRESVERPETTDVS